MRHQLASISCAVFVFLMACEVVDPAQGRICGLLVLVESPPVLVGPDGDARLLVQVIDYTADGPAANLLVRAELTALAPSTGASGELAAQMVFTDDSGSAEFRFLAGHVAPADYELRVRADCAGADATVEIRVAL